MGNLLDKALFNKTSIPLLSRVADLSSLRHKLISSNIANVDTPGYERKQIDFQSELNKAVNKPKLQTSQTHPAHIPLGNDPGRAPKVKSYQSAENSTGVNSVDVEQEMADLAQNQLVFEFGSTLLTKKFNGLKNAIRGKG